MTSIELEEMVVRFVGDTAGYVSALDSLLKATQQTVKSVERQVGQMQKAMAAPSSLHAKVSAEAAAAEAKRAAVMNEGKQVTANLRTASERYADEVRNLNRLMNQGAISQQTYKRGLAQIKNELGMGQGGFKQFGQMMGGQLAAVGTMVAGAGLIGSIGKAISLAAEGESVAITFDTIIGDAEKAKSVLTELRAFADWSPFNTGEVMEAGKMMLAMGTAATDLVPTMTMMGDVAGALNIPIKDLSYLMGTLKSVGRATTVDLNQFALRGIPIWRELATMMYGDPKAVDKVRKAVEAGQVSFDIVEKAFKRMTGVGGMFYKGMEKQAKGLQGLFATLQSEVENTLRAVGEDIIKNMDLKWLVEQVTGLIKGFTDWFRELDPGTKRFIVFTGLAVAGVLALVAAISLAGMAFNAAFGGMGYIVGILVSVAVALAAWAASTGSLKDIWERLVTGAKEFYSFIEPLIPLFTAILVVMNPFVGVLLLVIKYWKEISAGVKQFAQWLSPIIYQLSVTVRVAAERVRDVLVKLWNWIVEQAGKVFGKVRQVLERLFGKLNIDWSDVQRGLSDLMIFIEYSFDRIPMLWDVAMKALKYGAIVGMKGVVFAIGAFLVGTWPLMMKVITDNWRETLQFMLSVAYNWGKSLFNFFSNLFREIFSQLGNMASKLWEKVISGKFKPEDLVDVIRDTSEKIKEEAQKVFDNTGIKLELSSFTLPAIFGNMEKDAKKELDDALKVMGDDFEKFKKQRQAREFFRELGKFGTALWRASLQPKGGAAEEAGKQAGEEMGKGIVGGVKKEMQNIDAVLKGSLEEAIRIDEYRATLQSWMKNRPTGFNYDPNFRASEYAPGAAGVLGGAMTSQYPQSPNTAPRTPTQNGGTLGEDMKKRDEVIKLLGQIAGSLGVIEGQGPPTIKTSGIGGK